MKANVQYTPPTPTRLNCQVASCRRCKHTRRQSWPKGYNIWAIEVGEKWRHNDVTVEKLSISIKIHVVKPLCMISFVSTESVGSRRKLRILYTPLTPTRVASVGVGSVLGFSIQNLRTSRSEISCDGVSLSVSHFKKISRSHFVLQLKIQ